MNKRDKQISDLQYTVQLLKDRITYMERTIKNICPHKHYYCVDDGAVTFDSKDTGIRVKCLDCGFSRVYSIDNLPKQFHKVAEAMGLILIP